MRELLLTLFDRIEAWSKTGRILSYSLMKSSSED
jgi:hypothetical protein